MTQFELLCDRESIEELIYHLATLDWVHGSFQSVGHNLLALNCTEIYHQARSKCITKLATSSVNGIYIKVEASFQAQNWLDFHRFSRAKKITRLRESTECEGIYTGWMALTQTIRILCKIYKIYALDPKHIFTIAISLQVLLLRKLLQLFSSTPVSTQRTEVFTGDIKLVANLADTVFKMMENVSSEKNADGKVVYRVVWPFSSVPLDSQYYVLIYKELSVVRGRLKHLYSALTLTGKALELAVTDLTTATQKHKEIVSCFSDTMKKAYVLIDRLKNKSSSIREVFTDL